MTIVTYSYFCSTGLIYSSSTEPTNSSSYLFKSEICNATHVHQCFKYDNFTKQCTLKDCHIIFKDSCNKLMCTDGKKSKKKAVVLSRVLHLFGVGSFYVDKHTEGGIQLSWTLLSIILAVASLYFKDHKWLWSKIKSLWHKIKSCICNESRVVPAGENSLNEGSSCILFKSLRVAFAVLLILGRIIWWIVEAVKFGENKIKDGDGCALYTNMYEL